MIRPWQKLVFKITMLLVGYVNNVLLRFMKLDQGQETSSKEIALNMFNNIFTKRTKMLVRTSGIMTTTICCSSCCRLPDDQ